MRRARGRKPTTNVKAVLAAGMAACALVACAGGDDGSDGRTPQPAGAASADSAPAPEDTPELDSMAALGHSGLTGTMSDPQEPWRDARENSWATGDNPEVRSLYNRLLADHPALEGHHYNYAVNGATIDDLDDQYEQLMSEAEVAPDLIVLQFIDNDTRCDGTDAANAERFGRTLDAGLTRIAADLPDAQVYLTGPWASVELWTAWAAHHPEQVRANSGDGPCDVFDDKGRPREAGLRSMQRIVDSYSEQLEVVCARHPGCYTDTGALETFEPADRDVASDLNHLSVAGHRKYAEIAWSAMSEEIKQRR